MKKRVLAMLLSATLLFALVGCSGGKDSSAPDGGDAPVLSGENVPSSTAKDKFFDNIPSKLNGTTVKFATWIDHQSNEAAQVIEDFTDLTGIKYEWVNIPQATYFDKLAALKASGQAPDVVVCNSEFPIALQSLMPLNDTLIDVTDEFWDQNIVKLGTVGDKSYLVNVSGGAWDMGSYCVVYNKRIFEENGITTPALYEYEKRWTIDNFLKCCKELSKVCDVTGGGVQFSAITSTYANGMISYDPTTCKFSNNTKDPELVGIIKTFTEARENGYIVMDDGGLRNYLVDETMGIFMGGTYSLRATGWFNQMDVDDLGFAHMPSMETGTVAYGPKSARGYGIAAGASNPDGAAYFLRFFLNGDNYDDEEVYKNEEAVELYKDICKNAAVGKYAFEGPVLGLLTDHVTPIIGTFPSLFHTNSAQISTVLDTASNRVDACITRANDIVNQVKETNK